MLTYFPTHTDLHTKKYIFLVVAPSELYLSQSIRPMNARQCLGLRNGSKPLFLKIANLAQNACQMNIWALKTTNTPLAQSMHR
jgi:hypothetical protein